MKNLIIRNVSIISDLILATRVVCMIRRIAVILALFFFFGFIILVYLHNNQIILFSWPVAIPKDYFFSVYLAFTFILFYEVLAMIVVIPRSIADSIGKQYEIMSLVILRSVFEHVGDYHEFIEKISHTLDISILSAENWQALRGLTAGSIGSVFIFYLI